MAKVTIILISAALLVLTACTSSDDVDVRRQIDEGVAMALAAVPTATPQPTATLQPDPTPQPTATPVKISTPLPTATPPRFPPTPTPISIPSLIAVIPQVSGPAVTRLDGDTLLTVEPGKPLASRDITFTLEGLDPWKAVTVEFFDPLGEPAEWITEEEANFTRVDGVPVTARTLHADEAGRLVWLRIATQDTKGVWSVELTIDGRETRVTYPVNRLQLPLQALETVGVDLHKYQGSVSDTFFSALVPAALAVDLQAHLGFVVGRLRENLRVQSIRIPDIYLLGNRSLFEEITRAIGEEVGFEEGFYRSSGSRPGIYMQADYYEFELGFEGERPTAARVTLFNSADLARSASLDGTLIPLPFLESRETWNSQTDDGRISLQYAEAHMAVRFLMETFGALTPVDIVRRIAQGSTLASAMNATIGISYAEFQDRFETWLQAWKDPDRLEVRQYVQTLNEIDDSRTSISERRTEILGTRIVATRRALVSDAQQLLVQLQSTPEVDPKIRTGG